MKKSAGNGFSEGEQPFFVAQNLSEARVGQEKGCRGPFAATRQTERARRGAATARRDVHQRRAVDDGRERRASEVQVRAIRVSGPARVSPRRMHLRHIFRGTSVSFPPADATDHRAPHPPDLPRRLLAGSTSPSATSPGSPPAWTPPCSRWCAPSDVSPDRFATRRTERRRRANNVHAPPRKSSFLRCVATYLTPTAHAVFQFPPRRCAKGSHPCRPRARPPCRSRTGSRGGSRETPARTLFSTSPWTAIRRI